VAIHFDCVNCRAHIKVGNEHEGRLGKCPKCGASLRVPTIYRPPAVPAGPLPLALQTGLGLGVGFAIGSLIISLVLVLMFASCGGAGKVGQWRDRADIPFRESGH
jgi:hypothetical protein